MGSFRSFKVNIKTSDLSQYIGDIGAAVIGFNKIKQYNTFTNFIIVYKINRDNRIVTIKIYK